MAWKNLKQKSLADALIVEHAASTELDDVHALLNWSKLEAHLVSIHNKTCGEKAWPPLMMFKALLLQSWYKLSDPQLEKQLARDKVNFTAGEREGALGHLLFRRFVGLGLDQSVPDHSTLWRFRQKLADGVWDKLLQEINAQLSSQQLYISRPEKSASWMPA